MSNMKVISEKQNPLFNRKEVKILVESQVTPSKAEAEKIISDKFPSAIENVKINKVKGRFGCKTFLINANIYNTFEDKENFEPKIKEKKKK